MPRTLQGLSNEEAARRLRAEGPNELPSSVKRSLAAIAWELVREPMILLLIACGSVYFLLGDAREAALLLGSIWVIIGIELYQKQKTERALEALRDLSSPRALVIRDGARIRIPGREVVRGDLMVLVEGDRVPADGLLHACEYLLVDESLLTGESVPVNKTPAPAGASMSRPGGDSSSSVFAGTLVIGGEGRAEALATGPRSQLGVIGQSLKAITPTRTHVQRETGQLVRVFGVAGLSVCVMVVVLYGLTRGHWLQGILAGLTLAISMVPEELPVVLTIFLALGAWRLSRRQVLTRQVPAVEMLGSATVLCADKTGTLTLNRMAVQQLMADGNALTVSPRDGAPLPEAFHDLVAAGILACRREPFDPTEQALHRLAGSLPPSVLKHDWTLLREYPLTKTLLAVSYIWQSPDGRERWVTTKGAPEAVIQLCRLPEAEAARLLEETSAMAAQGLRVLGVAASRLAQAEVPDDPRALPCEWRGLIGFADPVRPSVPQAVQECREAGIRVIMITGDYPVTAQQIARQIGLEGAGLVLTGPALDQMDDAELRQRIRTVNVFARIVPEQKLRLVNALKANGEIVAMTGDGVNDAPALKAAHIGIAMGARGTDVAREAAALVLMDDDFSSIVRAVRMGRQIFDNLKKVMAYIFAIHVPIAGMALLPVMFHWPLVLLPVHIVFLELIIDPACSVAFEAEPEEADVMRRPPRPPGERIFNRRAIWFSLLQGASVLLMVLAVFLYAGWRGMSEPEARAMTVTTLIAGNLALIFTNRSWSRTILHTLRTPNAALWLIAAGTLGMLGLVLYVPALRETFHFAPLHVRDAVLSLAAGAAGVAWFELLKLLSAHARRS